MSMDARRGRAFWLAWMLLASLGASSQTRNFIVHTADPQHAAVFAQQAERLRRELAISWLGEVLPDWSYPCPITATVGPHLGAGGATSFVFDRGEVYGWRMTIQGSYERILDSVLPHEITHMIFASYFRRPVPRWADEGGATTVEHETEKAKHRQMLLQFLRSHRGIPFDRMFAMTEYPADIMPLYAQAYALAEYLIQQGGRRKYVDFLADGMNTGRWAEALQKHYAIQDLPTLQNQWVQWVAQGFPPLRAAPERMLAGAGAAGASFGGVGHPARSVDQTKQAASGAGSRQNVPAGATALAQAEGPNPGRGGEGSSNQFATVSAQPSRGSTGEQQVALASHGLPYRPGSTARPGVIWILPLAPLPAAAIHPAALAEAGGPANPAAGQNDLHSQPAAGDATPARTSQTAAVSSHQALAQTNSPTSSHQAPTTGGPDGPGPDGWFGAGSRPIFAPGSVGKALAQPPLFQPLASSAAVDSQLARPQMPQASPQILTP